MPQGVELLGHNLGRLLGRALGIETPEEKRRKAIGQFATSLFEQPLTEAESGLFEHAPLEAFQLGVKREGRREEREFQAGKERSARVEREAASERAARRSVEGQKEVAAYRAQLQGKKGPKASELKERARATEIGQLLSPLALAGNRDVASMLDLGKALRRGEAVLPQYREAVDRALTPLVRRRAELFQKQRGFLLEPGEDQELLDLDRIDEAMLRDALRFGEAAATRRAGGGQGAGVGATRVSRPRAAAPTTDGTGVLAQGAYNPPASSPPAATEATKATEAAPDRFDSIVADIADSGADLSAIMDGLQRRSPDVLAALGIDERDADAVYQRLGDAVMGGQAPAVQEQAAQVQGMPRTALGGLFGAGVSGTNIGRNILGEIGSRVRMPAGGNLAQSLGIVPRETDPAEERALGEITAQGVRQGVGRAASAVAAPFRGVGSEIGRGAREVAALAPEAASAGFEGALGVAAVPPQMAVSLFDALNRTAAMEPALANVPGQAQQSLFRAIGGEDQPGAGFDQALADLFAQPEQAMQAEPGRNVFGVPLEQSPQAIPGGPAQLMPDELAEIQAFLIEEERKRRIEKILSVLGMIGG